VTVLQRYCEAREHDSRLMLVGVDPVVPGQLAKTDPRVIGGRMSSPPHRTREALNRAVAAANA
jgi:hypothetical protein